MINISSQFHDDSFEGFNFFLNSADDTYQVEADSVYIKVLRSHIEAAMKLGKSSLNVRHFTVTYSGRYYDDAILEVYWG